MRAKSEAGVRKVQGSDVGAPLGNWEGAQVLLAVIRNGSLRRAADAMSLPVIVARWRIEEFERQVGARLFVRDSRGTRLTREGETVFATVERMEAASLDLLRTRNSVVQALSGAVRIRVPDPLGSFWLAPRIGEFQRAFPRIMIDFDGRFPSADDALRETDVTLTVGVPIAGASAIKLGRVHSMMYASRHYIEQFGMPASYDELLDHRLLLQVDDHGGADDLMEAWFPDLAAGDLLVMRSNSGSTHYWAVSQGVGLGALPTYLSALGCKLLPLKVGLNHASDVWLSLHPESTRFPRVCRMVDWIVEAFNPDKFPWFRDEFIHPDLLTGLYNGAPLNKLLDNCSGGGR